MREPDENVTCGASDLGEERGRPQRGVLVDRVHDDVLEVDAESLDVQVREGSLCALYIENLPVEHAEACGIQDLDNVRFELSTKRRPQWRRDDGRVTGLGRGRGARGPRNRRRRRRRHPRHHEKEYLLPLPATPFKRRANH